MTTTVPRSAAALNLQPARLGGRHVVALVSIGCMAAGTGLLLHYIAVILIVGVLVRVHGATAMTAHRSVQFDLVE